MIYAECFVSSLITVHRRRTLPAPGVVLCRFDEQVSSDRVIAEAEVAQGYRLLDLENELGMRVKDAGQVLQSEIGAMVQAGEVIARRRGLFKRTCVSPVQGTIVDARQGKVLIEVVPEHVELRALYPGKVVNLIPDRGVMIESTGGLIQGMWGAGRARRGRLECLVSAADEALEPDQIQAAHMGTILVGGRGIGQETLARALEYQVGGLIVGSIRSDLLPVLEQSDLSLVATEGFGAFAINAKAFDLLRSQSGQDVCLNPALEANRPEIFIPQDVESPPPIAELGAQVEVGTTVRALRAPYENEIGQVVSLPPRPFRLESGVRTLGAEVDLASVGKVFIPFENLEIVRQI